jgi:DNA-binding PadR family transcriptional regulator
MSAHVNKCLNLCRISGPQAYHLLKRLKMQGFIEEKFRETLDEHKR